MIIASMGKMMEKLAPSTAQVLKPEATKHADGLVKDIYEQMREDFMVGAPWVLHSDIPELLAAAWCIFRETTLCGEADRGTKEIIAWAISESNVCPYCIGVHHAAIKATGARDKIVEQWARYSFSSEAVAVKLPEQPHTAEYFGVMVACHYTNRMVSVFLEDKMMPLPNAMDPVTNIMASYMMGGLIRKGEKNDIGSSLKFMPAPNTEHAWRPHWAEKDRNVAEAIAAWSSTIETAARTRLNPQLLNYINTKVENWQGGLVSADNIPSNDIPSKFDKADRVAARLALLTLMVPSAASSSDVEDVCNAGWSKEDTLALVAWTAYRAARRCATWTEARG